MKWNEMKKKSSHKNYKNEGNKNIETKKRKIEIKNGKIKTKK